eukprot:gene10703-11881_t
MVTNKIFAILLWVTALSAYLWHRPPLRPVSALSVHLASAALTPGDSASDKQSNIGGFDADFAEAISKPLPQWYRDAKAEREALLKEVEKNRERIIKEFRMKYEVNEEQKRKESEAKWKKLHDLAEARKNRKNWFEKASSLFSSDLSTPHPNTTESEKEEEKPLTKENWEEFWTEEEKQTGFYLPGLFEVFPELEFKWPKWARRKDGSAVECQSEADCPFPQACCHHPIIPGQNFCCTGWGRRVLVPQYVMQEVYQDRGNTSPEGGTGGNLDKY